VQLLKKGEAIPLIRIGLVAHGIHQTVYKVEPEATNGSLLER
jgi:hypothetical protein